MNRFAPGWAKRRAFSVDYISDSSSCGNIKKKFCPGNVLEQNTPVLHALLPSRHGRCVLWDSWAPAPNLAAGSLEVLSPFASGTLLRVCRFLSTRGGNILWTWRKSSLLELLSESFRTGDPEVLLGVIETSQSHQASTETFKAQKMLLAVENLCLSENIFPKAQAINSHPGETFPFLLGTSAVLVCIRM